MYYLYGLLFRWLCPYSLFTIIFSLNYIMVSILRERSYRFAIAIVKLCQSLQASKEYIMTKQLLRSGTAIAALLREAQFGQSKADFVSKINVALKEANETEYWLQLLRDTGYITDNELFMNLKSECNQLIAMLVSSLKTARNRAVNT
jgi:four helix bundle protein